MAACANTRMKIQTTFLVTLSAAAFVMAAETGRGGFPKGYAENLRQQGEPAYNERSGVTTVYVNEPAAQAAASGAKQFPNGAAIVMEFAQAVKDDTGQPRRDAQGRLLKGPVEHVDVMRRGPGFGAGYGESRAGDWEFASYGPGGEVLVAPADAAKCAACHRNAGQEKDFVFRTRNWSGK
jgi:hypothetical protein